MAKKKLIKTVTTTNGNVLEKLTTLRLVGHFVSGQTGHLAYLRQSLLTDAMLGGQLLQIFHLGIGILDYLRMILLHMAHHGVGVISRAFNDLKAAQTAQVLYVLRWRGHNINNGPAWKYIYI